MRPTLLVIAISLMPLFSAVAQQTGTSRSSAGFPSLAARARTARTQADTSRSAYLFETAVVFPHLAVGESGVEKWETSFVIVNMTGAPAGTAAKFSLRFFGDDGTPMTVSFTTGKDVPMAADFVVTGTLEPGGSMTISVYPNGQPVRTGYAILEPPSVDVRLGGFAVFRQTVPNRPVFEAVVPLSDYDDYMSFMPFDNGSGFDTGMALVNPSNVQATDVYFAFLDEAGAKIGEQTVPLKAGEHTSFSLPAKFPVLAGKKGTLYIEGSSDFLTALGLRFNLSGGGAFTSVPVMNWSGLR